MASDVYTLKEDLELYDEIVALFDKWKAAVNVSSVIPDDVKSSFVTDGFYPGYTQQRVKVLFIARESLGVEVDYISALYEAIKKNKIGGWTLDQYRFFALQFYLAYGFNQGFPDWNGAVPWASELAHNMMTPDGVSFAFMNLSKFSNWSDKTWQTNWELVGLSVENGDGEDFLAKEVSILNPDVICSMNIAAKFGSLFGDIRPCLDRNRNDDVAAYSIKLRNGRVIPLLDTWHFSAPNKSPLRNFYEPIRMMYRELLDVFPSINPTLRVKPS